MPAPRIFWMSASVALLIVGASASYFLLVILPAGQKRRDELTAEISTRQAGEKQTLDSAEQARRAGQDMGKYSTGFGPPSHITGVSNHYNHKLNKCIVDVQTAGKNGTAEFVMDAYEQSNILWCMTQFVTQGPSKGMHRTCMGSKNDIIDPTEADKQIDALLRE
jgi:hypothetical protein